MRVLISKRQFEREVMKGRVLSEPDRKRAASRHKLEVTISSMWSVAEDKSDQGAKG